MTFDEIYNAAIWADNIAREYNVTITKTMALFDEISKSHTVGETKDIIEQGFIQGKGEENEHRHIEREKMQSLR